MGEITDQLTLEDVQRALPSKKGTITQEVVDIMNKAHSEPEFQGETLLQTAVTYEGVMQKNQVGIKDYLRAIRFCAYLMTMEDNYTEAYKKAFFDREFVQKRLGVDTGSMQYRELTSAASRYRRSKLVVDILTLSQAPLDLMFTGARYRALGVLTNVMETARMDRDKINAAKELLAATKGPENVKMELEVGPSAAAKDMQLELNTQLARLATNQKALLEAGMDIREVQKTGINLNFTEAELVDE